MIVPTSFWIRFKYFEIIETFLLQICISALCLEVTAHVVHVLHQLQHNDNDKAFDKEITIRNLFMSLLSNHHFSDSRQFIFKQGEAVCLHANVNNKAVNLSKRVTLL